MINKYQSILRMKNSLLATLIAGIVIILLFTVSCNKKDISIINSSDNASKEIILSYLNEQKIVDLNASLFIDTLISKSDWSDLSETSISKDVKLIYVPLNYSRNRIGMTFLYNNNTQSIYYSLITETPLSLSNILPTKNPVLNKPSDKIVIKFETEYNTDIIVDANNATLSALSLTDDNASNLDFELEADGILDFSETDPFSENITISDT